MVMMLSEVCAIENNLGSEEKNLERLFFYLFLSSGLFTLYVF